MSPPHSGPAATAPEDRAPTAQKIPHVAGRTGKRQALRSVFGTATAIFIPSWSLYNPAIPRLQVFALGLIAVVILLRHPLSPQKMAEIRAQLAARRGKV